LKYETIKTHYERGKNKMSNIYNETALENLYEQVIAEDEKGLIDDEINQLSFETGLHADDERDDILQRIAEDRFEAYENAPTSQDYTIEELEARVCACGDLVEECSDAYEHMTQGV
jgi:uncharacterized coiled-coil protein SlyX